jgi:hypothetical protein
VRGLRMSAQYTRWLMKRVVLAGVLLVAVSAAACSDPRGESQSSTEIPVPDGLPACDEIFAPGNLIDPATFGDGCRTADDQLQVPRPAVLDCQDGPALMWNDYAWGFEGQPMTMWPANDRQKVPTEQAQACLGTSQTTATTARDDDSDSSGNN